MYFLYDLIFIFVDLRAYKLICGVESFIEIYHLTLKPKKNFMYNCFVVFFI